MSSDQTQIPLSDIIKNSPKWATALIGIMCVLLTLGVPAILALDSPLDKLMSKDRDMEVILRQEAQIEQLNGSMISLIESQGEIKSRLDKIERERDVLQNQVIFLEEKLKTEINLREAEKIRFEEELKKKETRIKELEFLLAKLTDGKYDSFGK